MNALTTISRNVSHFIDHHIFGFTRVWAAFDINFERPVEGVADSRSNKSIVDDIMSDGMLWGVQKKKRTVEKKLRMRFGVEAYPDCSRMIRAKQNLIVCDNCGHYHELHTICGNCYKKVREESHKIIGKIREYFKYDKPVDTEVSLQYKDESSSPDGRPIVEMEGQRPEWFAKSLLSRTVGNKWTERSPMMRDEEPKVVRD